MNNKITTSLLYSVVLGVLSIVLLLNCAFTAPVIPPGNAIGGLSGPQKPGQLKQQTLTGNLGGAARAYADYYTGLPGGNSLSLLFNAITVPMLVTDIPRGPSKAEYGVACIFFSCIGRGDGVADFRHNGGTIYAIHSIDVSIASYLGAYSAVKFRVYGWNKKQYESDVLGQKKTESKIKNPTSHSFPVQGNITDRVTLTSGKVISGVKAIEFQDKVFAFTKHSKVYQFESAGVKSIQTF